MARIFISYSRADRQFVDILLPLLRRVYGHDSLWFDDDIHGGVDWWQLILSEIADCELFVFLISNDSLRSPYCQAEMREAMRLHKQILPVIVRPKTAYPGEVDDDLASALRHTQYVDMAQGIENTNALTGLYASVNRLLAQVPRHMPTPLSTPPINQPLVLDRLERRSAPRIWVLGVVVGALVIGALILTMNGLLEGDNGGEGSKETPNPGAVDLGSSNAPTLTGTETGNQTTSRFWTPMTVPPTPTDGLATPPPVFVPAGSANTSWTPVVQELRDVDLVYVPAGCFRMGSDPGRDPNALNDERPEHEVCFTEGFWLDQYEVTNDAYQTFVDEGGYTKEEFWSDAGWVWLQTNKIEGPRDYERFTDSKQPRVGVSWYEAEAYARWRGGRLPSEAEWEYAARGPTSHIFPWGDEYKPGSANFDAASVGGPFLGTTVSADRFVNGVSWIGAYNMAGNAAEWVLNTYRNYSEEPGLIAPQIVPTAPSTTESRGVRGGGWEDSLERIRSAFRFFVSPDSRSNMYGFRILVPN